jgi:hypothetical protein
MMISETKSILSFPDLIVRQLIRIHYTCFTVFVQFILGPLGRVALSPTAQMIEAEFSSLYASNRLDMLFCMFTSDNMTLLTWYGEDAEKAVYESFPDYDGSGYNLLFEKKLKKNLIHSFRSKAFSLTKNCHFHH